MDATTRGTRTRRVAALALAGGLAALGARAARASDGVIELNQHCATQTGCLPGDGPAFPIRIEPGQGGSYRLTSNLVVPTELTGILVRTAGVTIDLNGFAILGANTVTYPSTCSAGSASANGWGVQADPALAPAVVVKDGSVRGLGEGGLSLGGVGSRAERVVVEHNCGNGVFVGNGALVVEVIARANALNGILASPSTKIEASVADANGANGIRVNGGFSIVESSVSNTNFRDGILSGQRSLVRACLAMNNGGDGIELDVDGYAVESAASGNAGYGVNGVGTGAGVGSVVARANALGDFQNTTAMACNLRSGASAPANLVCP